MIGQQILANQLNQEMLSEDEKLCLDKFLRAWWIEQLFR